MQRSVMKEESEPRDRGNTLDGAPESGKARKTYEPPRLKSGELFERVVLNSGAEEGVLDC